MKLVHYIFVLILGTLSFLSCKKKEQSEKSIYNFQGSSYFTRDTTIQGNCTAISDTSIGKIAMTVADDDVKFVIIYNDQKIEEHDFMKSETGRYANVDAFYHTTITVTADSIFYLRQSTPFLGNCRNYERNMSLGRI